MKIPIYSLKDVKVGFGSLFSFVNDDVAKNGVVNSFLSSTSNPIQQTPQDYELHRIGTFDDSTGEFESSSYLVGTCLDIISQERSKREVAKKLRQDMEVVSDGK